MTPWLLWLIAAAVLALAETATLTFVLAMFAGGAAAGAISAAAGAPAPFQWLVAAVVTVALLLGVRPVARRHLVTSPAVPTGTDALVGARAVVLAPVDAQHGRVRLNGAEWSARTYDDASALPVGAPVRVLQIAGATAVVVDERPYLEAADDAAQEV